MKKDLIKFLDVAKWFFFTGASVYIGVYYYMIGNLIAYLTLKSDLMDLLTVGDVVMMQRSWNGIPIFIYGFLLSIFLIDILNKKEKNKNQHHFDDNNDKQQESDNKG